MSRSFTVEKVENSKGKVMKTSGGRYMSANAQCAAKKALTKACKGKRGKCSLKISMRETTRGSKGKVFTYDCGRVKLTKPKVLKLKDGKSYTIKYKTTCKKA